MLEVSRGGRREAASAYYSFTTPPLETLPRFIPMVIIESINNSREWLSTILPEMARLLGQSRWISYLER